MDVATILRQRLQELGLDQQALAAAAKVTESYVSQLLTGRKPPPASERTDIYEKIDRFLHLPAGQLAKVADAQRREELQKKVGDRPVPLYREVRELILRKCKQEKRLSLRTIFETRPFGELERLVTQKLLDVVKKVAREELAREEWLKAVAKLNGRKYEQVRVAILDFLDAEILNISPEQCVSFLDPMIESWDIDMGNFGMEIVLNRRLASGNRRRIEFVEREAPGSAREEPGFRKFIQNQAMSGNASPSEIEFLQGLRFDGRQPTPLCYYRLWQVLRDPLHFGAPVVSATQPQSATRRPRRKTAPNRRKNRGKASRWK